MASQLTAALSAAWWMGYVPVVGLLSADQIAEINDAASAANVMSTHRWRRRRSGPPCRSTAAW